MDNIYVLIALSLITFFLLYKWRQRLEKNRQERTKVDHQRSQEMLQEYARIIGECHEKATEMQRQLIAVLPRVRFPNQEAFDCFVKFQKCIQMAQYQGQIKDAQGVANVLYNSFYLAYRNREVAVSIVQGLADYRAEQTEKAEDLWKRFQELGGLADE